MVSMSTMQFFICGMVFTIFGYYWGYQQNIIKVVQKTIDHLIDDGFIRTRTIDGEIEMLKHWEDDNERNG
jgi:hypothetical protein